MEHASLYISTGYKVTSIDEIFKSWSRLLNVNYESPIWSGKLAYIQNAMTILIAICCVGGDDDCVRQSDKVHHKVCFGKLNALHTDNPCAIIHRELAGISFNAASLITFAFFFLKSGLG